MNPDDPILNPTPHRPPSSMRQHPMHEQSQSELLGSVTAITQSMADMDVEPRRNTREEVRIVREEDPMERRTTREEDRERRRARKAEVISGVISQEEDMRRLFEECEMSRDNCVILREALVFATPEGVLSDPVIQVCTLSFSPSYFGLLIGSGVFIGIPTKMHKISRNNRSPNRLGNRPSRSRAGRASLARRSWRIRTNDSGRTAPRCVV